MSVKQLIVLMFLLKHSTASYNIHSEIDSSDYLISKYEDFVNSKNISPPCNRHMREYIGGLKSGKKWAVEMFDSGSKIPSGIVQGNLVDLGFFDECLKVEADTSNFEKIYGKYCIASMSTKAISNKISSKLQRFDYEKGRATNVDIKIRLATCLPNSCSSSDMEEIYALIIGPDVLTFNEELCQSKSTQPELNGGSIATLTFFGVIFGLLLVSTSYDVATYYLEIKPAHALFIAFSVFTNGKKLLTVSEGPNQINCLHGLRVISTMWVIFAHSYVVQATLPMRNTAYVIEWAQNQFNMIVMGGTVSVDTFFLMSGLVVGYIYMGAMAKGTKFNVLLYYLHRFLRLTPAFAVVVVIYLTLLKHMGSGPIWPSTVDQALIKSCEIGWWKSLLYIQNYGAVTDMCVSQSWYLAVDTQLFLLSPILLIPLKYWPKFTLIATGVLAGLSVIGGFLDAWFRGYSINMASIAVGWGNELDYMKYYYVSTWARASPWLMGLILGYLIFKIKQRDNELNINKILIFIMWVISLLVLLMCVFGGHDVFVGSYNKVQSTLYISLVRPAWALAVGWIIIACVTGYGGPVNWFLSLPVFQILSKLTFTLYLVHYAILYIVQAQMRTAPMFDNSYLFHWYWGTFAYCLVVALIFTLAFESPIIVLEKVIFGGGKRREKKCTTHQHVEPTKRPDEIV